MRGQINFGIEQIIKILLYGNRIKCDFDETMPKEGR